jgi:hypothetical protein
VGATLFINGAGVVRLSSGNSDSSVSISAGAATLSGSNAFRASMASSGAFTVVQSRTSTLSFGRLSGAGSTKAYVFTNNGGSLFASTSTAGVSDERVKKEVTPAPLGLNLINQLNPVEFKWKDLELGEAPYEPHSLKTQYGLLAQELKDALTSLGKQEELSLVMPQPGQDFYKENIPGIDIENDPVLGVDYIQFIPILIKAIKELSARLDELET